MRALLLRLSARPGGDGGQASSSWVALALDLVDSLDQSCTFRYFRTREPDPSPDLE